MKTMLCYAFIAVLFNACNQTTPPNTGNVVLTATFTVTDTIGEKSTQFHSKEELILSFSLTNSTNDTLTYPRGNSGPSVIFHILKNDSTVAASIDGYAYLAVALPGFLPPGQNLQGGWQAPTTPAQNPKVVLSPGSYTATVSFPTFDQAKVNPVSPITFSIVP